MPSPDVGAAGLRLPNNPYALIDDTAEAIFQLAEEAVARDEAHLVSDATVVALLTAAVRLYAKKCDGEARAFRPLKGRTGEVVTPTEVLTACTELLRAVRLGPMEFALWSRRRPEDYHDHPQDTAED